MTTTNSKQQLAEDLAAVASLIGPVSRFRRELEAAEPAGRRLEAARYPSAGSLQYDINEARERCREIVESLEAVGRGIEIRPLEDAV